MHLAVFRKCTRGATSAVDCRETIRGELSPSTAQAARAARGAVVTRLRHSVAPLISRSAFRRSNAIGAMEVPADHRLYRPVSTGDRGQVIRVRPARGLRFLNMRAPRDEHTIRRTALHSTRPIRSSRFASSSRFSASASRRWRVSLFRVRCHRSSRDYVDQHVKLTADQRAQLCEGRPSPRCSTPTPPAKWRFSAPCGSRLPSIATSPR